MPMQHDLESNKTTVQRFNREVIEGGDEAKAAALLDPEFVNRTAPPGADPGPQGMVSFLCRVLHSALGEIRVEIHDQIAEGDRVVTRKTIQGLHRGELFGVQATGKRVAIEIIDIVRLRNGRYLEHWGSNNLASVLAGLSSS